MHRNFSYQNTKEVQHSFQTYPSPPQNAPSLLKVHWNLAEPTPPAKSSRLSQNYKWSDKINSFVSVSYFVWSIIHNNVFCGTTKKKISTILITSYLVKWVTNSLKRRNFSLLTIAWGQEPAVPSSLTPTPRARTSCGGLLRLEDMLLHLEWNKIDCLWKSSWNWQIACLRWLVKIAFLFSFLGNKRENPWHPVTF